MNEMEEEQLSIRYNGDDKRGVFVFGCDFVLVFCNDSLISSGVD